MRACWVVLVTFLLIAVGCGESNKTTPQSTPVVVEVQEVVQVDNRVYTQRSGEFRCSDGSQVGEKRINLLRPTYVYGAEEEVAYQVIIRACVRRSLSDFMSQDVIIAPGWTATGDPSAMQLVDAWREVVAPAIADYLSGATIEGLGEPFILDLSWLPAAG